MGKRTQSAPPKELTRKQLSRQAKDARTRRWLIYGTGIVVGLAILVLAYGLVDQYVLLPRRPVATVNGTTISRRDYEKRLAYRRWDYENYLQQLAEQRAAYASDETQSFMVDLIDQQIGSLQSEIASLPSTVLSELVDEEIVRQEATHRGITVSPEEVQVHLEEQFGYVSSTATPDPTVTATATIAVTPTAEPTVASGAATPTATITTEISATATPFPTSVPMTREQYDEALSSWLSGAQQAVGFTESDLRAIISSAVLRQKLQEAIGAEVPTVAEQVHARHILLKTAEEAQAVLKRLQAGEDFAALAQELSTDEGSKAQGGDLGWFSRGVMLTAFEDAAFSLPVGQISDIVTTEAGFHIIEVLDHQAERELDPALLEQAQSKAFDEWLTAQRTSPNIKISLQ